MPRRALRCVVDLNLHAVSAPGVWLPSREDVYLSVSVMCQYRNTCLSRSVFPILLHETFRFEKTFYTALDPSEVADMLEDEVVVFELLQLSEYTDGAILLASYSSNARDFLFPYPSLTPIYSSTDRELLLTRTGAFPGISPKLEFSTKTVIKESISAEVDALDDALEADRARSRRCRSPTRRPRSASLSRRMTDMNLYDCIDGRPPFVVRKLDADLTGRLPGCGPDTHGKSRTKRFRPLSRSRDDLDLTISRRRNYLEKAMREPTYKKFGSDDEDAEVSELTSRPTSCLDRPRPRSTSPLLTLPSFRARYGLSPYSSYYPTYSEILRRRLEEARLARLYDSNYPYYPYYSPYLRRYVYDPSLYDLELSTRLAKTRRYYPMY